MTTIRKYSSEFCIYSTFSTYSLYSIINRVGILKKKPIKPKNCNILLYLLLKDLFKKSIDYFWNFQCNIFGLWWNDVTIERWNGRWKTSIFFPPSVPYPPICNYRFTFPHLWLDQEFRKDMDHISSVAHSIVHQTWCHGRYLIPT